MRHFTKRPPKNYQWLTYIRSGSVLPPDLSFVSLLDPQDWQTNANNTHTQRCNLKRIVGNCIIQVSRDQIDANDDAWCRWFYAVYVLDNTDVNVGDVQDPSLETAIGRETVLQQGVVNIGIRCGDSALVGGTGSVNAFSQIMPSQMNIPIDIVSNRRVTNDQHIVLVWGAAFNAAVDRDDEALYIHTTSVRTLIQLP